VNETYPTMDAFYADRADRKWSPEWDFGVHWTAGQRWPLWRLSWVVETGELYAFRQSPDRPGPNVLVLGVVPMVGEYPHSGGHGAWVEFNKAQAIEAVLEGWAEAEPRDLDWVRDRLAAYEARST
jgi:hypothetical protein